MSQKFVLNAGDTNRENVLRNVVDFLHKLPTMKSWEIDIAAYVKKRSPKQRAALFGAAYRPIMEFVGLSGSEDKDDLHAFYCGEYWGWHPVLRNKPLRTTTKNERGERDEITTVQALEFYAFIQRHAAEQGIYVPDPDPLWKDQRLAA